MMLAHDDITKRDEIMWGYTLHECQPYLDNCIKNYMAREGILHYLGLSENKKDGKRKCTKQQIETCQIMFQDSFKWACENCKK